MLYGLKPYHSYFRKTITMFSNHHLMLYLSPNWTAPYKDVRQTSDRPLYNKQPQSNQLVNLTTGQKPMSAREQCLLG